MSQESVEVWTKREFGDAKLGDKRRPERLVEIALNKAKKPEAAMTTNCKKNGSQLITRFFSREEVTMDSVTNPHKIQTVGRCKEQKIVLAVQDTTSINLSSHSDLEGLGHLGSKKKGQGVLLHTVLAVTPGRTPLGILHQEIWARNLEEFGIKKQRHERPFEDKESYRWAQGVNKSGEVLKDVEQVIVIGDRESDIFEVFNLPRPKNVDLLIRASQNRCVEIPENGKVKNPKLFEEIENAPVLGTYVLKVPARNGRKKRDAKIVVRAKSISVAPPKNSKDAKPIKLYCVFACETESVDIKEPIEWRILTTLTVDSFKTAEFCINSYSVRWVIEEYHKVIKSGCKIERLQFETLERMYPAMGVCSVVAWRVLFLSKYARENSGDDASFVSTELERNVLSAWLRSRKEKNWRIKTAKDFVNGVAMLGGFLGRKCDGNPGTKTLWQGLRSLEDMMAGYLLAMQTLSLSEKN